MRGLVTKLVVLLALLALFSYLILPGLVEGQIARRLQESTGVSMKVEVSSGFPPEMLLGRIDRIQVSADRMNLQGVALYDARADLRGVNVSLPGLLDGSPEIETRSCSLAAAAPALRIDQNQACLGYLGLGPV